MYRAYSTLALLTIASLLLGSALAHPNCVVEVPLPDGSTTSFPQVPDPTLAFCTEWTSGPTAYQGSCCQMGGPVDELVFAKRPAESMIDFASTDPAIQACAEVVKELYCTLCAPLAGHIYASEGGNGARPYPWMCDKYCTRVYAACANVQLNVTTDALVLNQIHFPGLTADMGLTTLAAHFPTVDDYCTTGQDENARVTDNGVACYTDTPTENQGGVNGPSRTFTAYRAYPNLDLSSITQRDPEWRKIITRTATIPGSNPPRLAVSFQSGVVISFVDDPEVTEFTYILTDAQTQSHYVVNSEYGCYGITFHPDFATNGWFYLKHSTANDMDKLIRYTLDRTTWVADPDSALLILEIPVFGSTHHGSVPIFVNGKLVMANGDGIYFGNNGQEYNPAEDPESLLGKIIRIDVDSSTTANPYAIPSDNPSFDNMRGEVWASGFRNPWQIWHDPVFDHLWVGSVGQNKYESIYVAEPGKFHGWHKREGYNCYYPSVSTAEDPFFDCKTPGEVFPVLEYPHADEDCSSPSDIPHCQWQFLKGSCVIGGFVYRGYNNPSLAGRYIFANSEPSWLSFYWSVVYNPANPHEISAVERLVFTWPEGFEQSQFYPSTLGLTHDGEMLLVTMIDPNYLMKLVPDAGVPPRPTNPDGGVFVPPVSSELPPSDPGIPDGETGSPDEIGSPDHVSNPDTPSSIGNNPSTDEPSTGNDEPMGAASRTPVCVPLLIIAALLALVGLPL